MAVHPLAGSCAPAAERLDISTVIDAYYDTVPASDNPEQRVAFGTSGHRGTSLNGSFTETHIRAISQAVCEYRATQGIHGPLFIGVDTHALSAPAAATALEVFAANGVAAHIQHDGAPTPTPVISRAILRYNSTKPQSAADGVVITPSHNPPTDGGFKYNPPHGGPADTDVTAWVEKRANELMAANCAGVKSLPYAEACKASCVRRIDYITPYVDELGAVIDMPSIAASGLRLGADPLGGSSLPYWEPIAKKYGLNLSVVNSVIDPSFGFMPLDHDGKIRMDCSSPWAMAGLVHQATQYDVAFGTDPDADRHGIVTPAGLMNPNHYLAVAVWYLFQNRDSWPREAMVGKTLVTSSMIDRVAAGIGRTVYEVPVGFKWFVAPLMEGRVAFGGEESAGASFLQRDGSVWSTDKDGLLLCLLAAEIAARSGKDPAELYAGLQKTYGAPLYERLDVPATREEKKILSGLCPSQVSARRLAGSQVTSVLTSAPGNNASIGGVKVSTTDGWFAARPSGTENIYKIYAESFVGAEHLELLQEEAKKIVAAALNSSR